MIPNVGCLFTRTDKLFILEISPLLPHSQHNLLTTPPPLLTEWNRKDILRLIKHYPARWVLFCKPATLRLSWIPLRCWRWCLSLPYFPEWPASYTRSQGIRPTWYRSKLCWLFLQCCVIFLLSYLTRGGFWLWVSSVAPSCSLMGDAHGDPGGAQGGSREVEAWSAQEWRGDPLFPESTLSSHKELFIEHLLYASRHEGWTWVGYSPHSEAYAPSRPFE